VSYTLSFKSWALLLTFCLVALPLYGQVQDTVGQQQGSSTDTLQSSPAMQYAPVAQTPPPQQTQETPTQTPNVSKSSNFDDYLLGKMDGKRDARGKPVWILAGLTGTGFCLCIGVAGIGVALIVPPSPPESALMGKSSTYIQGYSEGYKSKARVKNAGWATLGCAMAALINIIINLATGQTLAQVQ
jgi:hypothetical protein